jgi:hypothetical protein
MEPNNMRFYKQVCSTPQEARKQIQAGRLKGFTDINPMWRFKKLTETFGPCGIGWKYVITRQIVLQGAGVEQAAFVDVELYYLEDGKWSDPVPGTGGSMFVAQEKNGPRTNDECFKMALSDAIGTACKALGMSADIYFEKDRSKYSDGPQGEGPSPADAVPQPPKVRCLRCGNDIIGVRFKTGEEYTAEQVLELSRQKLNTDLCWRCLKTAGRNNGNG